VQVFHLPNDIATPTAICGAVGCQTHHRWRIIPNQDHHHRFVNSASNN
jgi:hypothetical protein